MSRGAPEGTDRAPRRRDQVGLAARKPAGGNAVPAQGAPKRDRPRAKTPMNRRKSALRRRATPICEGAAFTKLPFDIQHRLVVQYSTSSPTDFERLRKDVTNRIVARLNDATPSAPDADTGTAQESSRQLSQRVKDWEAQKAGYIRQNVGRAGEIAYRPKSPKPGTDHLLCANCFEDGRKSYLQSHGVKWKCPRCPTSISRRLRATESRRS